MNAPALAAVLLKLADDAEVAWGGSSGAFLINKAPRATETGD